MVSEGSGQDFFISYTEVNKAWACWIAVELERAGYTTVLQALDFRPGHDFVHEMHHAMASSARTIAVLSPAYCASEFGELEWRTAFKADPSGERGLLVLVRVQPCQPPGVLATRVYVDLIDLDEDSARARLLAGVDRTPPRPIAAPFPGAAAPVAGTTRPLGRFPGAGPMVSNQPARNRAFTGRDTALTRLHSRVAEAGVTAVAVHGLGGVGKTALAVEFGHRFASDYDIIWWIPAEQPTTIITALTDLAGHLGVPASSDQAATVAALFALLRGRGRWLLVYDNAEHPDGLDGLLPPGGAGSVLVTSRWPAWGQHADPERLDVLDRAESVQYLTDRAHLTDPDRTDELAELLGDLPLALEEAAAYLEQTGLGLPEYLALVRDRTRELFGLGTSDVVAVDRQEADRRRVATVWSVSLDRVRAEAPAAEALMALCAFLGPEIPRALPATHPELLPEPLAAAVADPLVYSATLAAVGRYSLAALTPGSVGVHRLVAAVVRARLDPAAERTWAQTAVALLRHAFPDDSEEVARWPDCEQLLPHLLAVCEHAQRLDVSGEQSGWLLGRASTYLRERGQYRQALPLAQDAVAVTEAALGPDHPTIGILRSNLGDVLRDLGDLRGARTQLENALQISETALGPDHPDIGILRSNLGDVLRGLGDLYDARTQLEKALQISETALGPDHPDIGTRRSNLGNVLRDLGDLRGARTQLEHALQISETALGPDHPDIGIRRSNLGRVLRDLGELHDAHTQCKRALQISETALGPDHPTIGIRRNNLGRVLHDLGDLHSARTQLEHALQISETALGPDHPDIGTWRSNLGGVLRDLGELHDAHTQCKRALQISETALGPDHHTIGTVRNNLGRVLHDLGDLHSARTQLEHALQISETALGPDHPQTVTIRVNRDQLDD